MLISQLQSSWKLRNGMKKLAIILKYIFVFNLPRNQYRFVPLEASVASRSLWEVRGKSTEGRCAAKFSKDLRAKLTGIWVKSPDPGIFSYSCACPSNNPA